MPDQPFAYFITFRTYGTWLHGDERGSTAPLRNVPGTERILRDDWRRRFEERELRHAPVQLVRAARAVIEAALIEWCASRGCQLIAHNVRSNHVHLIVASERAPEFLMNNAKSWCTRRLREAGLIGASARVWSRHGSTQYLWDEAQVEAAWQYVVHGQEKGLQELP